MALKKFRPMTPSERQHIQVVLEGVTKDRPEKGLIEWLKHPSGRNNQGRVTARHRGGGHPRAYRNIDFRRNKDDVPARVASIEYDPYRSALLARLIYRDGDKRYILAPLGLHPGDTVMAGPQAEIRVGNALPIFAIPVGTTVHNVELTVGRGGQLGRSAGSAIQLVAKEGDYGVIRLPSGELRKVHRTCRATVGQLANTDHKNINLGKAGRKRWMRRRPTVRGAAMNPCDHKHGGGEGRAPVGGVAPVSFTGKRQGLKTCNPRKLSQRFILARRAKRKR